MAPWSQAEYLERLGITDPEMLAAISQRHAFFRKLFPSVTFDHIFIGNRLEAQGLPVYAGLWVLSRNLFCLSPEFLVGEEQQYEIIRLHSIITVIFKAKGLDWEHLANASSDSTLQVTFVRGPGLIGTINAVGINCHQLYEVASTYLVPPLSALGETQPPTVP